MHIGDVMTAAPMIPVLTFKDADAAVPTAKALVEGGLRALEVTLRSAAALDAVARIAAEVPEAIPGIGTVTMAEVFATARAAGARFAVSPGFDPVLSAAAGEMPWMPGIATASELMAARRHGHRYLKFFPAESSGGTAALAALAGPFADVRFCPTGGIGAGNAAAYLALDNVLCVGGSWVAPGTAIAAADWPAIRDLAVSAARLVP